MCPLVKVTCCNSDEDGLMCGLVCVRSEMIEHLKVCELRLVNCQQGCGVPVPLKNLAAHNCLAYLRKENESLKGSINVLANENTQLKLAYDDTIINQTKVIQTLTNTNQAVLGQ